VLELVARGAMVNLDSDSQTYTRVTEGGDRVKVRRKIWIGWTPLHAAAEKGSTALVAALLAAGAVVNTADEDHRTPLHVAAQGGHNAVAEALLAARAKVDAEARGTTPLYDAATEGHVAVVRTLLAVGAEVNRRRTPGTMAKFYGETPLYMAEKYRHTEVMAVLKAAGGHDGSTLANLSFLHCCFLHCWFLHCCFLHCWILHCCAYVIEARAVSRGWRSRALSLRCLPLDRVHREICRRQSAAVWISATLT